MDHAHSSQLRQLFWFWFSSKLFFRRQFKDSQITCSQNIVLKCFIGILQNNIPPLKHAIALGLSFDLKVRMKRGWNRGERITSAVILTPLSIPRDDYPFRGIAEPHIRAEAWFPPAFKLLSLFGAPRTSLLSSLYVTSYALVSNMPAT